MLPTPPDAPVTRISPPSALTPCSCIAIALNIAVYALVLLYLLHSVALLLLPRRNPTLYAERTVRIPLWLPAAAKRTVLHVEGPGVDRRVAVSPGQNRILMVEVDSRGPWTLDFHSNRIGYLQPDDTPVSVRSVTPTFSSDFGVRVINALAPDATTRSLPPGTHGWSMRSGTPG